jgi:hypothetical protein
LNSSGTIGGRLDLATQIALDSSTLSRFNSGMFSINAPVMSQDTPDIPTGKDSLKIDRARWRAR